MLLTISDSIAIKIINKTQILAGIGNELHAFDSETKGSRFLCKLSGKIHGIECCTGINDFILVYGEKEFILVTFKDNNYNLLCRRIITDWISSGKVSKAGNQFFILTAHSVAVLFEFQEYSKSCKLVEKISCKDKSTLYCSYLLRDLWGDLIVFGGNALGEVIVWKPCEKNIEGSHVSIYNRIPVHNGVIFSIDINIDFQLMITTSDDRSVRFWNIETLNDTNVDFSTASIVPYKSGYAHSARVFKGKIIRNGNDLFVLSAGEDSFVCLWNQTGELLFKKRLNFGATIWNIDYEPETKTLFSCGSDGNIFKYNLNKAFLPNKVFEILSDNLNTQYLSKVKFLLTDYMFGVTNTNELIYRNSKDDWKKIDSFASCKCTVLEIFENVIALGGYKTVTVFEFCPEKKVFNQLWNKEVLSGVIRSICFFEKFEILVCDELGNCKIFNISNFETMYDLEVPQLKERWITKAFKLDSRLIASNRQGNLFLYHFQNDSYKLTSVIKHLHGNLGVTDIVLDSNNVNSFVIRTCGHDNSIKSIEINRNTNTMQVISRESVPISWVEKFAQYKNNELLLGFNDNHFIVWQKERDFLIEILCGGGHRCWDYRLDFMNNKISVIYIKNKKLYAYKAELENISNITIELPRNNWHIKPCNVLRVFQQSKSEYILFSGGEENLLKISKFECDNVAKSVVLKREIYSHISSIKTLQILQLSNSNFLIFSAGGRAQICITELDSENFRIKELLNYMLKSSDFDRKFFRNTQDIDFDPETRIMSLDVKQISSTAFEVFVGCSDGKIRKFSYELSAVNFTLIDEIFYNRCVLHVKVFKSFLLTAATDGILCFRDIDDFEKILFKHAHHESGINSLDIKVNNDEILIATGGDDQTVVFSKLLVTKENCFQRTLTKKFQNLHTAQVNGVKFSNNCKYLYSVGVDQFVYKVNLINFEKVTQHFTCIPDVKGLELDELKNDKNICFVYGCGLQIIDL